MTISQYLFNEEHETLEPATNGELVHVMTMSKDNALSWRVHRSLSPGFDNLPHLIDVFNTTGKIKVTKTAGNNTPT